MAEESTLQKGDHVSMQGQTCIGEIVAITGKYATVAFSSIEINIPLQRLERAQIDVATQPNPAVTQPNRNALCVEVDSWATFHSSIDLHGMSVNEALRTLDRWIDRATLIGHKQLKIIHGKGKGTLRNAVRTYLQSHEQVKCMLDKHIYIENAGVTWLEVG